MQAQSLSRIADFLALQIRRAFSTKTAVPEEWSEGKRMPSMWGPYGLSSWCISVLGLWILASKKGIQAFGQQFFIIDAILLMNQGVASWGADVLTFGFSSWWKPVDRIHAVCLFIWLALKPVLISMSLLQMLIYIVIGMVALACKYQSERSISKRCWQSFLFWHTAWHVVPPASLIVWAIILR
mmetsp:Transcript_11817/g.16363  ORF Transcript_11817/g.16363 Transcript_11817/m.16363 type:complete len:183 (-) Transcript_11817:115-663(-)